jgi:hypothetical protein
MSVRMTPGEMMMPLFSSLSSRRCT